MTDLNRPNLEFASVYRLRYVKKKPDFVLEHRMIQGVSCCQKCRRYRECCPGSVLSIACEFQGNKRADCQFTDTDNQY